MSKRKTTQTVPLATLVEDMEVYPRHGVDAEHVSRLLQAIQAGANLPPPRVDATSKTITDGWHRCRAWLRHLGPQGEIPVEIVTYKDRAAMIADAVAMNATHGRRLDKVDQTRCVLMLRSVGFDDEAVARTLNVTAKQVERLAVKVANVRGNNRNTIPGTVQIALKHSAAHLKGLTLTSSQAAAHRMFPGTNFTLVASQLRRALEENMLDMANERLVEELTALRALLVERLSAPEKEPAKRGRK